MKKKINKIPLQKIILSTVATVGIIGVAVLAPNIFQVARQFSGDKKYNRKKYVETSIGKLLNKGLIKFETTSKGKFIKLTEKGERELLKYELGDLEIKKPKKWDKKWRIVIFDIKEKRRGTRDILRSTLIRLGFVRLQNSVWIFPYNCEELIIMLKSSLFVGKDILYMTVDKLENDKWLKEIFGL
ncbi:CRISPR-associated endonuclease Cas2 [Patescibacteria group bacterium]|nr:CRISPR-associated endonuclease Cas2 [Patescibacteria group bacterium]MCG2694658.1 CRISPR-associated endonuclease Cas2 [Candidatus Parcubacteria bacterium]